MKKIIILVILIGINHYCVAQLLGPQYTCFECENLTKRVVPTSGIWYNPEQPGTGYTIEVQNNRIFGAYYGYNEQGKQIWLTFLGDLVESNEVGVMWTFDSEFKQFEGGTSFNQVYQENNRTDYQGAIHIEFSHQNHAKFSVNNGIEQNIVPIAYGSLKSADFPNQTSYTFPELHGMWTFVYYLKRDNVPESFSTDSEVYIIMPKFIRDIDHDGFEDIYYTVVRLYGDNEIFGEIQCSIKEIDGQIIGPKCHFEDRRFLGGQDGNNGIFKMTMGGLGIKRLFGEMEDGSTFNAFRINYRDYLNGPFKLGDKVKLKKVN